MTNYIETGKIVKFNDDTVSRVHPTLPVYNYIMQKDPFGNIFLEKIDHFPQPGKLYGDVVKNTNRILHTFLERKGSTGVMLSGEKGSGKTLLAKNIVITAAQQHNIPTIVINAPWAGDSFNKFLQEIHQPCIIMFDEFEKVYDRESQKQILTLLDGSFPSQKLFLLTTNDKWRIDEHMRNRPGRIFYMLEFDGLTADFVREYCEDNLNDKSHINNIVTMTGFYNKFNFDMLKALVEEMNRYNESPQEATRMLNTKIEYAGKTTYDVVLYYKKVPIECDTQHWIGNPIQERISVWYDGEPTPRKMPNEKTVLLPVQSDDPYELFGMDNRYQINMKTTNDKEEEETTELDFGPEDIVAIDPVNHKTTYKADDYELVLKKVVPKNYNIWESAAF